MGRVLMLFLLMTPFFAHARQVAGVRLPDTLQAGEHTLILNGAGVRTKYFVDAYVAGLYLKSKQRDPRAVIDADEPMAVRMQIVSSLITAERMEDALRESFRNAAGGDLEPIQDDLERLISVFKQGIKKGDIYDVIYIPGKGIDIHKNGTLRSTTGGYDFKRATFATWLGERPVQEGLKRSLLGQ